MLPNFYVILGVAPGATPEEVRQAYRLRAREAHPDAQPNDTEAAERFKAIAEAYRVLSNSEQRLAYDAQLRMMAATYDAQSAPRPRPAPPRHANPEFKLHPQPGVSSIGRLTEPTRFYLLGELAPTHIFAPTLIQPLHLAVLLDRSSSMRGPKIFEAKRATKSLLAQLNDEDHITLIAFDDRPETLLIDETAVGAVGAGMRLDSLTTRGATQLSPALEIAINSLQADVTSERLAALVLITDGRTYGDEESCLVLAERARLLGVPIIAMGLGLEWNRELLDNMASVSGGSCAFVENPARLTELLEETLHHLRSTVASNVRLSLDPAPGVSVLRASTIAPDLADVFAGPHSPGERVEVKFGALTVNRGAESTVALWELILDPYTLTSDATSQSINIGTLSANWMHVRESAASAGHLAEEIFAPLAPGVGLGPLAPEVRLALELLTAYRLHVQADQYASAGSSSEAAAALTTSALRLRSAGDILRANEAQQAAAALDAAQGDGPTATLRAKYQVRNASMFHQLRRKLREGQDDSATL